MPDKLPSSVNDYLIKNAFLNWTLEWNKVKEIDTVVVVPAICEYENIKRLLLSLIHNPNDSIKKSLILFVINNSENDNQTVVGDNALSLNLLRSIINDEIVDEFSKKIIKSGLQIGLMDASSKGKEFDSLKAGVGLARKIGMDMALQIFDYSTDHKKIIACLDADCVVDKNYLKEIYKSFSQNIYSAAVVDFEHLHPENNTYKSGILSYEIFLRHYVCGLLFARSPFAFHTVGSTVICDFESYIKVGGMNTRKAAEDFYLLQKLAKISPIQRITTTKVYPSARESWRVPFGTGRTMTDYLSNKKEISVFHPDIYKILKDWLEIYNSELLLNPESVLGEAKKINPGLYNFLIQKKFKEEWTKILNNTNSKKQLDYQRKNWFDAFKTLKLVHYLRDYSFSMMDVITGVETFFNIAGHSVKFDLPVESNNRINILQNYLTELKNYENDLHKRNLK